MPQTAELARRLAPGTVLTDPEATAPFLRDWFGEVRGTACAVLRPRSTAEVAEMVRTCADLGLGIVPQGGNTGLVDGAMPEGAGQVVLALGRMNRIRDLAPDDFSVVAEAGCILQTVKEAATEHGMMLPVSLGAQGTAQIGGIVSTNAGGINVLRHGMTREQVLGLEVVLADGRVWNGLSTLRKDNTGPDLKQLFIGAEGTFGVVTAAAMRLVPAPVVTASALIGLPGLAQTTAALRLARRACCDLLSAFEFLTPTAMDLALEATPGGRLPLSQPCGTYVLMELAASGRIDLVALLEAFLARASDQGLVMDGVIATSDAQAARLWALREAVNEAQARRGPHLRSDVSVRLSDLPAFTAAACTEIEAAVPGALAVAYGHIGDGNVHLNVLPPPGLDAEARTAALATVKMILNDHVDRWQGSISAEHGIGRLKRADWEVRLDPVERGLLDGLKHALDPAGRMNPGCQRA